MKKGDKVLVPTGAGDHTVEGVIRSVTKTHAMCEVPIGSMSMGRRSTQALRKLEDLTPVGGGAAADPDEPVAIEDMGIKQLRAELKDRDLPVSGNKADLVARLAEAD